MRDKRTRAGFTLGELLVVIVIVSIISGYALGSFTQARRRNVERTYAAQLRALAGVAKQYKARNQGYWDVGGVTQNLATLQTTLGTDITIDGATVTYNSSSRDSFAFYAVNARHSFTARIDVMNEPCCHAGPCLMLPACPCPGGENYRTCDNMCVHDRTDRGNCGNCGVTCAAGQDCVNGACV